MSGDQVSIIDKEILDTNFYKHLYPKEVIKCTTSSTDPKPTLVQKMGGDIFMTWNLLFS